MGVALLQEGQPLADLVGLLRRDVELDAAQQVGRVVDAVAAEQLQQVHDRLPVAPGVHEQRVKAGLVGGHAQPQHMAVDALQLGHDQADDLRPLRRLDGGQLLHAQAVGHGVGVGADAADALQQVHVLHPVAALHALLDAAVDVAQPHGGVGHGLAVHGELKVARLLEGGVLRPDGDDEPLAFFGDNLLGFLLHCAVCPLLSLRSGAPPGRSLCAAGRRRPASRPAGTGDRCWARPPR